MVNRYKGHIYTWYVNYKLQGVGSLRSPTPTFVYLLHPWKATACIGTVPLRKINNGSKARYTNVRTTN